MLLLRSILTCRKGGGWPRLHRVYYCVALFRFERWKWPFTARSREQECWVHSMQEYIRSSGRNDTFWEIEEKKIINTKKFFCIALHLKGLFLHLFVFLLLITVILLSIAILRKHGFICTITNESNKTRKNNVETNRTTHSSCCCCCGSDNEWLHVVRRSSCCSCDLYYDRITQRQSWYDYEVFRYRSCRRFRFVRCAVRSCDVKKESARFVRIVDCYICVCVCVLFPLSQTHISLTSFFIIDISYWKDWRLWKPAAVIVLD